MKFFVKMCSVLNFHVYFSCKVTLIYRSRRIETTERRHKGSAIIANMFLSLLTMIMDNYSSKLEPKPSCIEHAVKSVEIYYTSVIIAEFEQYLSDFLFCWKMNSLNFKTLIAFFECGTWIEEAFIKQPRARTQ